MTEQQLDALKNAPDPHEYHKIGKFWYRAGTVGLSKHKNDKKFTEIGHCNYFREKDYKTVIKELNNGR